MYSRLLDKSNPPTETQIAETLGAETRARLAAFEGYLKSRYDLKMELRFPFGANYGWGYKYSHKSAHICYAFFESGAFTVTLQIGDKNIPALEAMLPSLSPKGTELWQNRYPCGEHGGWIHYRVLSDADLTDVCALVGAKVKPTV